MFKLGWCADEHHLRAAFWVVLVEAKLEGEGLGFENAAVWTFEGNVPYVFFRVFDGQLQGILIIVQDIVYFSL